MQPIENAVIAAAGLGSRLGLGHPKCMLEISGVTLLSRMIRLLERHVSVIHVVIGYREELIIEHCARHHPSVVLVRNPEFRTTNTAHSLSLGARHLAGKCVFVDGDLVIEPDSFAAFLERSAQTDLLLGLCTPTTENAVYAHCEDTGDGLAISGFTRDQQTAHEWANIFTGPSSIMDTAQNYVFEQLANHLPLPGMHLNLAEIDTTADLKAAQAFVEKFNL